ncbi:ABC transporter substrate-binding protein [Shinella sp. 838]|uniref:ABC transporter substrate-binding protein n=1 Tax=unclassified Shinella TaxID=2643062 RepID=UPI0003C566E5|nr:MULTISPECIES: ABC transporter substrate-binding protein [unclassified Shinella]EYR84507.1 ABC-type branched-chain amino acid transport system periplasmic component [Shinella sp. DD12]MCA0339627.1 ABC transporter substrate-binding protein [Pseudomonadota bacterium]MDG4674103.1 ABC transporter substrate-binding protein [Shinella sp. 838]TAA58462.1 twin-arginine translocation signal domain-containing protein [Shinella sp. JR1-6]
MFTRRDFLKTTAAGGAAALTSGLSMPALAQNAAIKLGYVSPQTGPLAAFGEADSFVIDAFLSVAKAKGLNYEIVVKDSQSNPNRAAEVAKQLIVDDEVNLVLVASTPETTNPVATTCEAEGMPCISTVAPWQPWFIGQQGNPGDPASWKPFDYAYHFFWGLEDVIAVFTNMWAQVETNRKVGGLFPNDGDGNAWGDKVVGFPPVLEKMGYSLNDPGRYQNMTDDFSAQINAFKAGQCEIITGVVIPPDFTTFWNQAKQQGFVPKVASIGKALLFPQAVEALGTAGHNLSSEVWWSPSHPFKSSLTGESSAEVAAAFTKATGRPWTQPIGFAHALFELAVDALSRAEDPTDGDAVAAAIAATKLDTLVGNVAWGGAGLPPFAAKNVAKTPLVGGQWRLKEGGGYDLVITDNKTAPAIPVGGTMEAIA